MSTPSKAREYAARYGRPVRGDLEGTLDSLEDAVELREALDLLIDDRALQARALGGSWSEIARACHITRQGAVKRYRRHEMLPLVM